MLFLSFEAKMKAWLETNKNLLIVILKEHYVIHHLYLSSFQFYDGGFKQLNKIKQVVMNLKLINVHLQAIFVLFCKLVKV